MPWKGMLHDLFCLKTWGELFAITAFIALVLVGHNIARALIGAP